MGTAAHVFKRELRVSGHRQPRCSHFLTDKAFKEILKAMKDGKISQDAVPSAILGLAEAVRIIFSRTTLPY